MNTKKEWFKDWFDTDYYHILYQDRDYEEAELFMKNLTSYLQLDTTKKILDMPSGKGRHSVFLNSLGYNVVGADLSKNNITYAKKFENSSLRFEVYDMRDTFSSKFDAIFNLFTSFGYFDDATNISVLKNLKNGLEKGGIIVIDYLNVGPLKNGIITNEVVTKSNINFNISKSIVNDYIIKDIKFTDAGNNYHYTEKIKYLPLSKFKEYFYKSGLTLKHTFGEYNLSDFDPSNSNRLILIAE